MKIGFVGFGDAGSNIAKGLSQETNCDFVIYAADCDLAQRNCNFAFTDKSRYSITDDVAALLNQVEMVIVLVPCNADVDVFNDILATGVKGKLFIDCCSTKPEVKSNIAAAVEKNGNHYIDAAIMETVAKNKHKTPIIFSGSLSSAVAEILNGFGMNISVVGETPGEASLIKICRSSFMKGLAALLIETEELCNAYAVREEVFASIALSWNDNEFIEYSHKLITAAKTHARRQGDELKSVVSLQNDASLQGKMAHSALAVYQKLMN